MPFDKNDLDKLRKNDPSLQHIKAPSPELESPLTIEDIHELIAAARENIYFNSLSISGQYISPEGIALLATQLKLKMLRLRNCALSDVHFSEFSNNKTIEELDIGYNKSITDFAIKSISQMINLRFLNAEQNEISDNGAISLANHATLRYLNLNSNNIGSDGTQKLLANKNLIGLDLRINKFDSSLKKAVRDRAIQSTFNTNDSSVGSPLLFKSDADKAKAHSGAITSEQKQSPSSNVL